MEAWQDDPLNPNIGLLLLQARVQEKSKNQGYLKYEKNQYTKNSGVKNCLFLIQAATTEV